jgi:hypothetical protein
MNAFGALLSAIVVFSGISSALAQATQPVDRTFDVVVYGGTSGGVTAAVQAARDGKRVVIIEPIGQLGGMTSAGLGWTDFGKQAVIGGLSREFYRRVYQFYEVDDAWKQITRETFVDGGKNGTVDSSSKTQWVFEPHVAKSIFDEMAREANVHVVLHERLDRSSDGVRRDGKRIVSIRTESGQVYRGKVFIDASYEGDLMAGAGVRYAVGREGNDVYGETINGIQAAKALKHQLLAGIDPYVVKGDPSSGLLPGVNKEIGGADGSGDDRIQAYCYRLCLTDVPENRVMIEKPAGYDEGQYELLFRQIDAGYRDRFFTTSPMPNVKTDMNNAGGVSIDYIGMNYRFPEADYAGREKFARQQEDWQRGLIWSLQNHPRVPAEVRESCAKWGLAKDEFVDSNNWPEQMYVREARRMLGVTVATERTLADDAGVQRPIGMGSYMMDSHNVQRYVDDTGHVRNEGDVQIQVNGPYRIDYGVITPKADECTNLLVPVCVSASHIAYGSIRMEPVFMVLGQSAGSAASLAIDTDRAVQEIDYELLRRRLLKGEQVLKLELPAAAP